MTRQELADTMGVPLEIVIDIEDSNENECLSSKSTMLILALALKLPHHELVAYADNQQSDVDTAEKLIGDRQEVIETSAKEPKVSQEAGNALDAHDDSPTPSSDSSPAQPGPKPFILPPMFSRNRPQEPTPAKVVDEDQQKWHVGLQAIAPILSKPGAPKPVEGVPQAPKSPFVPRHAVQRVQPFRLADIKSWVPAFSVADFSQPEPRSQSIDSPTEIGDEPLPSTTISANHPVSAASQPDSEPVLATRKSYVPQLASQLPVGESQRETGIFRIDKAPDPAPNQRVNDQFGKSVPGLTPPSKPFGTQSSKKRKALEEKQKAEAARALPES